MVEYTGENWQKDILSRDWLDSYCLIDNVAGRLYKDIYSAEERKRKLLEIPEMQRLSNICRKECKAIERLQNLWSNDQEKENTMIDMPKNVIDKVTDATDGVSVKKLNVEIEKDGKTYKVDVGSDKAKAEVK